MNTLIDSVTRLNALRWQACHVLPHRELEVEAVAAKLCAPKAKAIYQNVANIVWGSPDRWWFVAIVHEREASQDFRKSIAQGDFWNQVSRHIPRGIGPFRSFVDAAVFTLRRCAPYPAKWHDWSIGGVLTLFEAYNGFGGAIRQDREGRTATLKGKVGDGPSIRLTANKGSVSVRREGSLPSEAPDGAELPAERPPKAKGPKTLPRDLKDSVVKM